MQEKPRAKIKDVVFIGIEGGGECAYGICVEHPNMNLSAEKNKELEINGFMQGEPIRTSRATSQGKGWFETINTYYEVESYAR
jgi:hypothetical protein